MTIDQRVRVRESHFAVRLGPHLFSSGTARLSVLVSGFGEWDY
jgi:hypothetical protein